jgi:acetyl-CoA synthetase
LPPRSFVYSVAVAGDRFEDLVGAMPLIGQYDEQTGQAICTFVTLEGGSGETSGWSEPAAVRGRRVWSCVSMWRPRSASSPGPSDHLGGRLAQDPLRLLRDVAEGRELGDVTTLRDPGVVHELEAKVQDKEEEIEPSEVG